MRATIIRMGDGFFIPKLSGFDDIKSDTIDVDIELKENLDYKELKNIAILEKYQDKLKNQIEVDTNITQIQQNFRDKHNIDMNLDRYLKVK